MRVAVFGATGGTGLSFIRQAAAAGHEVSALARRPEALDATGVAVRVAVGDVRDPAAVRRVIDGADAVVSALGIGMHRHPTTVYSQGTGTILAAMGAAGVRRLLVVSTTSMQLPRPPHFAEWAVARALHAALRAPYADMALMERSVRGSALDWTLARAARLTNGARTGRYRAVYDTKLPAAWSISRADLADYLLTHLAEPVTYRRIVELAH